MGSRMERYNDEVPITSSRTSRNSELYKEISNAEISRVKSNSNFRVIESNEKNIDIDKIKKYISQLDKDTTQKRKMPINSIEVTEEEIIIEENNRDYDINSVLLKAKQNRQVDYDINKYKKLKDEQYEILKKVELFTDNLESEEDLEEEFNTNEKTLIDLINTIHGNKDNVDLFADLREGSENTIVTKPIKQEIEENKLKEIEAKQKHEEEELEKTKELVELAKLEETKKIDDSFYTNSLSFSKDDFDNFEEIEKTIKKNNMLTTIGLIVLFIAISITLIVIANYIFELGLF